MAASEFDEFCRFAFTFLEKQGRRYLVIGGLAVVAPLRRINGRGRCGDITLPAEKLSYPVAFALGIGQHLLVGHVQHLPGRAGRRERIDAIEVGDEPLGRVTCPHEWNQSLSRG